MTTTLPTTAPAADFAALTAHLQTLIAKGEFEKAAHEIRRAIAGREPGPESKLLEGLFLWMCGHDADAVKALHDANVLLGQSERPGLQSPYSAALLRAQLNLPPEAAPVVAEGNEHFAKNIAALVEVDPVLAREIEAAPWPSGFRLVEFWGGPHLFATPNGPLLVLSPELATQLAGHCERRDPIAVSGIGTGQELAYLLAHRKDFLHGMARAHYLFEPRADLVRAVLHLRDFSAELRARELMIFGGSSLQDRVNEVFAGTLRYAPPAIVVGDPAGVRPHFASVAGEIAASGAQGRVRQYYASEEFAERLRAIAQGTITPRILIVTCRWTTFLKYCAADFDKAFRQAGCDTRCLIEENDAQALLPALVWRELDTFKPDAIFMVSHARPSLAYVPRELAFIGYIQDKCGPLLTLKNLDGRVSPHDLFVCLYLEHERFVTEKGVPRAQTFVMPVPVDETMFYPLPPDDPKAVEFTVDASFVKHGVAHVEEAYRRFSAQTLGAITDSGNRQAWGTVLDRLYRATCSRVERCFSEADMEALVTDMIAPSSRGALEHMVKQQVASFHCVVYAPAWRFQFLEALDAAGITLALYGNNWEQNARLGHCARGPVDRERGLNYVYNFTKVNLSINHAGSMAARIVECGLAGGFMMAAAHEEKTDALPATWYFERDKELVLFSTTGEVVERCRHFLAHDEERRAIAERLRARALKEHTCKAGAASVLARWRDVLARHMRVPS
jgi:spore maturation protein CgeB